MIIFKHAEIYHNLLKSNNCEQMLYQLPYYLYLEVVFQTLLDFNEKRRNYQNVCSLKGLGNAIKINFLRKPLKISPTYLLNYVHVISAAVDLSLLVKWHSPRWPHLTLQGVVLTHRKQAAMNPRTMLWFRSFLSCLQWGGCKCRCLRHIQTQVKPDVFVLCSAF